MTLEELIKSLSELCEIYPEMAHCPVGVQIVDVAEYSEIDDIIVALPGYIRLRIDHEE